MKKNGKKILFCASLLLLLSLSACAKSTGNKKNNCDGNVCHGAIAVNRWSK